MIAGTHNTNGHTRAKTPLDIFDRLTEFDRAHFERRQEREAVSSYTAGTSDRMNGRRLITTALSANSS